jgi:hypothetical protein
MTSTTSTAPVETAIASVETAQLGEHTAVLWQDGHVSIEHWEYSYTFDPVLDHVRLTGDQARQLRDFLNRVLG